jgi:hypothetical protein
MPTNPDEAAHSMSVLGLRQGLAGTDVRAKTRDSSFVQHPELGTSEWAPAGA